MSTPALNEWEEFLVALAKGVQGALADGKLDYFDFPKFFTAFSLANPAIKDFGKAFEELKNISSDDLKALWMKTINDLKG